VRLACRRALDDLERWPGRRGACWFDSVAADKVCAAISQFRHTKGEWARRNERIKLEPWQCFVIGQVFGWKRRDGNRRFRTAYTEVPRKNAKSTLSSGVGLYMVACDGEPGAEVYSAATAKHQARIVFDDAKRMANKDPDFRAHFGVSVGSHAIYILDRAAKFEALASDNDSLDGLNVHCAIVDELHAHKTRHVWDVLETATGARSQPLIWAITTAGSNRAGICYEQRTYLTKILEGVAHDDTYFGLIYTIDDGDDPFTEAAWRKANPNYGVSIMPDDMQRLAAKAQQMPAAQANFLTKRVNVWVSADEGLFDMAAWARCAVPALEIEQFMGCRCWVACDLASRDDLASICYQFERAGEWFYFWDHYLPQEKIQSAANSQYQGWETQGLITATDGATIDFARIEDDIVENSGRFQVVHIGADPWQATQFMQNLEKRGAPIVEVRQTVANLSEPLKDLIGLHKEGRMHHDGNPMVAWMISNVVGHYDAKDNVFPKKERPENKIDGAVAMIMARHLAMRGKPAPGPIDVSQFVTG
jgi:phage terminase large subunit-like protein